MHYKAGRIKLEIGLAKGKKQYDKRESEKAQGMGTRQTTFIASLNIIINRSQCK
jgi:tmRNA-binding protein